MKPICVIAGLTATGKSNTAIEIAKIWNAEIISADSVAVYKHLDIGSAKLPLEKQEGIVHHLIDVCDIDEEYNVARFQKEARRLIKEIQSRGKNVIVVGGTGLYIKALLYDYRFEEESQTINERTETTDSLYEELLSKDPKSAETIHPNNRKRIIRALESYDLHKTSKHLLNKERKDVQIVPAYVYFLQGNRQVIYERINQRVDIMIQEGLLEEVKQLLETYPSLFTYQSVNSIGYKEFEAYFNKIQSLEDTRELIKRNTRRFAKRQLTWFKNQQESIWVDIINSNPVDKIKESLGIKK